MMNNYLRDFITRIIKNKEQKDNKKRDKQKGWANTEES